MTSFAILAFSFSFSIVFYFFVLVSFSFSSFFVFVFVNENHTAIMLIDRWYQGFDWEGLRVQSSTPPIVPKVFSEIFTRHVTVSTVKTVD